MKFKAQKMKAMVLTQVNDLEVEKKPLVFQSCPIPSPQKEEILLKVSACGVCHTELDEIEGRTTPPVLPVILGHQVVGTVVEKGKNADLHKIGDRLGVGWIFASCGKCQFCKSGNENLCRSFKATGRDANGGYAEYMCVHQAYAFNIPEVFTDEQAAPLMCAGAIGYRSLRLTELKNGQKLGLMGFGASAQLVLEMINHQFPETRTYVFARNEKERRLALMSGAVWAGDIPDGAPEKLHAIIDTTPAWKPVKESLKNLEAGGRLVINAIRKEDKDKDELMSLNYETHLWEEKEIKSVANVAKRDIAEFLSLAAAIPIIPEVESYDLEDANAALLAIKEKNIKGAKVLKL